MTNLPKFNELYNSIIKETIQPHDYFDQQGVKDTYGQYFQNFKKQLNLYPVNNAQRIRMLLDLLDGSYIINDVRFNKTDNIFWVNDKQVNARQLNEMIGSTYQTSFSTIQNVKLQLEKSGNTVELSDQPNKLIVKGAYTTFDGLHDQKLTINQDGSITSNTGYVYKDIKQYLGF